jgi:hypothetical protein
MPHTSHIIGLERLHVDSRHFGADNGLPSGLMQKTKKSFLLKNMTGPLRLREYGTIKLMNAGLVRVEGLVCLLGTMGQTDSKWRGYWVDVLGRGRRRDNDCTIEIKEKDISMVLR